MPTRRDLLRLAAVTGAGLAVTSCSRPAPGDGEDPDALLLRVWDEAAASVYRETLDGVELPDGYTVEVEAVSWEDYWTRLPLDVAGDSLPDLLWMNTANLAQMQANDQLMDIGEALGDAAGRFEQVCVDQYRRDDALWGLPQLYERTVLLANRTLTDAASVDPAKLAFDPARSTDTLRDAARALTVDGTGKHPGQQGFDAAKRTVWGFSAQPDRSALLGPFIAANGGRWQEDDGRFAFASPQGIAAVQYLADLCHGQLAPDGPAVVGDPHLCRDLFTQGKLGLLQTGTYDLEKVASTMAKDNTWDVHPPVPGPAGPRPLVHTVAMVATASKDKKRNAAVVEVLRTLASVDGCRGLAQQRLGIPAHRDLRDVWQSAWKEKGVDVSGLGDPPSEIAQPDIGLRSADGAGTALGIIAPVFAKKRPAADALPEAQKKADETRGEGRGSDR